jgi:hypothetical protein
MMIRPHAIHKCKDYQPEEDSLKEMLGDAIYQAHLSDSCMQIEPDKLHAVLAKIIDRLPGE